MKKIIILITVISLSLFSCGNTSNEKSIEKTENVTHEEHQHNAEILTIELKNGEKWKVDDKMKGKAHDELHKWLLPYIDLVKELSEAKHETKAEKQFQKIENSLITFNQYFQ